MSVLSICKYYLDLLISNNHVYRCICDTKSYNCDCKNKNLRKGSYVLNSKSVIGNEIVSYNDQLYGNISFKNEIYDVLLCRDNGLPLYNFISVICDIKDKISYIIRGSDHIINTWKQILIYRALKVDLPTFIHLPLVLDINNKKISKRNDNNISILDLLKYGYIRTAIINYVCTLGYSYNNQQYFDYNDIISFFNVKYFSKNNAQYCMHKLLDINRKHLQSSDYYKIIDDYSLYLQLNNNNQVDLKYLPRSYTRYSTLVQLHTDMECFTGLYYVDNLERNKNYLQNYLCLLENLFLTLTSYEDNLNSIFEYLYRKYDYSKKVIHTVFRICTIHVITGPDSATICESLGYSEVYKRIKNYYSIFFNSYS